jgi:hypothetical protein
VGDDRYLAAPDVTQTFAIAKAPQTISFTGPDPATFGDPDFDINPTSDSGLAVSVGVTDGTCTLSSATAPATVHITGAGTCEVTATQGGNVDYLPATDAVRSFAIAKANQTITFAALADKTWGDADFAITATAGSGLPVSFAADGDCTISAGTVHILEAGHCSITASQAGDDDYNPAADVAQSFTIKKADQTIAFAALPNHTFGDADFTVAATSSSGLPVAFALGSGTACTLAGKTVHIAASGTCSIVASQTGNGNYNAAPPVTQSLTIVNSTVGSITGLAVHPATGGQLDFRFDARRLTGALVYVGPVTRKAHGRPRVPPVLFTATSVTSLGISADGNTAWVAGTGRGGVPFLLYVEDNTDSRKPKHTHDVAKLWIGGVPQDGDGTLAMGFVTISQR